MFAIGLVGYSLLSLMKCSGSSENINSDRDSEWAALGRIIKQYDNFFKNVENFVKENNLSLGMIRELDPVKNQRIRLYLLNCPRAGYMSLSIDEVYWKEVLLELFERLETLRINNEHKRSKRAYQGLAG
jgi:hypothetical protein